MLISPAEALTLLEYYKYIIIFPIAVIEGPIIIIISGFLVYLGILNGYIAYTVLVVADITGDFLYYLIGKYWRSSPKIKKFAKIFGFNESTQEYLEGHFKRHKVKTFLIAKVSHGIGSSAQIASGIAGVDYKEFLFFSIVGTIPKAFFLFFIGYYLGSSYEKIDGYFQMIAFSVLGFVVCVVLYRVIFKYIKNYLGN